MELVNTAGAVENLQLLMDTDSNVDIALLQGGIGSAAEAPDLMGIASVFYEPLWIFQRELTPIVVSEFTGRRIAMGQPGSGTLAAMRKLTAINEIATTSFAALELGGEEAGDALLNNQVDMAAFVASVQAPYIRRLLLSEGIYLTPFIRAEAYTRHNRSLSSVVLPRGAADLYSDIPSADVTLLAPVASLIAKKKLHPTLVVVLVEAAQEIHSEGGLFEKQGEFPSVLHIAFPINEDARRYLEKGPPWLQRYLPFWIAVSIERLQILLIPLATLLIPLFKIAPPTYRWRIRKRIYSHYHDLFEVESILLENPSSDKLDQCSALLTGIEKELLDVEVPLSYADQLYHLRMHVRFVKQRVDFARKD